MRFAHLLVFVLLFPPLAHAAEERLRVAVLDVRPLGDVGKDLPSTLATLSGAHLAKTGVFQVVTGEEIRQMLSVEAAKMQLGCEDASCFAEIGGALGAPYVLTGTIGRLGRALVLGLSLVEIAKAKTVGRETVTVDGEAELAKELERMLARVVAPVLEAASGTLVVTCSEEGAVVKVDGVAVGTTPLAPRAIGAGPRTVSLTKEGFIEAREDVVVPPKGTVSLAMKLLPSQDFLNAYRAGAERTRLAAWATAGGGLVAVVGAAALFAWSASLESQLRAEAGVGPNDPVPVTDEQSRGFFARDLGAFALLGTGAILGGVSTWLFATGDDPDRYAPTSAASP